MRNAQQLYVDNPLKSFVGLKENRNDRYFLFKLAEEYQNELLKIARLDSDDVVLSMQSHFSAPLWNLQRSSAGYDYVFVDETHLFNENERRVLPYLTRSVKEYVPVIMAFDEAQSIGGRRSSELEEVGIPGSKPRRLSYIHRNSPEIFRLARDLVERSTLMFSEFSGSESVPSMSEKDLKKCRPPVVLFAKNHGDVPAVVVALALELRLKNYPRIGIIVFEGMLVDEITKELREKTARVTC